MLSDKVVITTLDPVDLAGHASADAPDVGNPESYLTLSSPCLSCGGRGVDVAKDATYIHMMGTSELSELRCDDCRGSGREVKHLAECELMDFVIQKLADRMPDLLARLKEEVVKEVMES